MSDHRPDYTTTFLPERFRPTCPCGWRGVIVWPTREQAQHVYERHIKEGWRT